MKKQLFLLALGCCAFIGAQSLHAQTPSMSSTNAIIQQDMSAETQAKKVVALFTRTDALSKSQEGKIYKLYESFDKKITNVNGISDAKEKTAKQAKIKHYIEYKMKEILTEEQYAKFLEFNK
ncbi:hypothetical protein [Psychroserpens ponticola]|uniref:DUF4168 domain-containing protein n=1 Tax=Psychroserpens ponticola TaxID=2932268 RepID=A0ABY7RYR1_9FLAO|nr:hypothetical protein [Psychroserpens ponticola]WCO02197.1 hypothetical protein MUN68_001605 [Psychroserpens ponticola]